MLKKGGKNMSAQGALSGIKVLDLSRLLPGPFCSMILADHGARVISVAHNRFISDGLFLDTVNRNKNHMSLDLKTEEGKEIFFRLARETDVILEGFRPGVVHRLGIDYDTIRKINPGVIYCSISGYGQTGPLGNRAGHDVNFLGVSGVLDLIGESDRAPSIPGIQIADIAAGGMYAAIGILLALQSRVRSGKGQYIDISMTDGMVSFLPIALYLKQLTGQAPQRGDNIFSHRYACYNIYETADGRYFSIGAIEEHFWKRLCEHLGVPEYASLQFDDIRREEILDFMRTTFRKRNLDEWEEELVNLDVCWTPIRNLEEVLQDPLFREREMIVEITGNDQKNVTVLGVPIKLSDTPGAVRTPPVRFGENTASILREIGYTKEEIDDLSEKGVI
jgi:crotonobetainyl-CoA:carnitine CoA-transferase CaiB-like acyl-CoA transferase